VAGMHTIHEDSNGNGRLLGEFETPNNMLIKAQLTPTNVYIWEHGRYLGPMEKLIRSIMYSTSKRHSSSMKHVRSCRRPNCDSDLYLFKLQVQEKLANIQIMAKITRKKWHTDKLIKQPEVREEYESKLQVRLQDRDTEGSEIRSAFKF
jgi:hypothetical protein